MVVKKSFRTKKSAQKFAKKRRQQGYEAHITKLGNSYEVSVRRAWPQGSFVK